MYIGGSQKSICIWDRQEQKVQTVLTGHSAAILSLDLSTDDQRMVSGSEKGNILIHSLKHGTKNTIKSPLKQVNFDRVQKMSASLKKLGYSTSTILSF